MDRAPANWLGPYAVSVTYRSLRHLKGEGDQHERKRAGLKPERVDGLSASGIVKLMVAEPGRELRPRERNRPFCLLSGGQNGAIHADRRVIYWK